MKIRLILLLITSYGHCIAQSFHGEATIPAVETDGFYRVWISPKLSAHLNDDFSDVRIFDKQGLEVPYLFEKELPAYYAEQFIGYEIVEKKFTRGCCTSLTLQNKNRTPINNIHLVIKNAEAARQATLLGSDDKQQWFALKDHFLLRPLNNSKGTAEAKIVDFPWSNYEFYQVLVNDSAMAPLNILNAGYYDVHSAEGTYTDLPLAKLVTADSAKQKKTYVQLFFDKPHFLDKLEIVEDGSRYYRRRATLSEKRVRTTRNGKRSAYYHLLESFELTSGRTAVLELEGVRAQQLLIIIENEDNPPLKIAAIKPFQLNRYLTAWLKEGDQYKVKFGDRRAKPPIYDLAFFKDSIPSQVSFLEPADVKLIPGEEMSASPTFFTSKVIIWVAIVGVVLVLGFMSVKIVREAGKTETKD
jgi:hypothetical protein